MPTFDKGTTALLAGVLNTIFVFSHALPRDIGQTADARPQFRPQIPGWVITTRCRVPLCRQREHENSTTIRVGKGTTCFCCRLYSHRRRLKSRVISLSAVGIEDLSASIDSGGGSDPSTQLAVCTSEDTTEVAEVADCVNEGEAIFERIKAIARDFEVDGHRVRLQVATLDDYHAVADVRFSVFSPVHMTLRQRFRERSCMLMKERRHRGAFCLVAVSETIDVEFNAPKDKDEIAEGSDGRGKGLAVGRGTQILGTVECSKHEFEETPLALDEGISRLYLTEVAVRKDCRRLGLGKSLLGLVDDVARHLRTREVYLHVNEINEAAINLYTRCGYEDAPNCASSRTFTNKLGLSGGFYGQRHRLMRKTIMGAGDGDVTSPPAE